MKLKRQLYFQWKHIFPDFTTLEGSCLFIKKLIAVSLSAITYIRGIFPEKAYGNKTLNGVKLKILKEDCGSKAVMKFINLVRNCYDAVDKKYLQQMSVGIVPDPENKEEVVELYNLVFRYKDDNCSVTCNGENTLLSKMDPVQQATLLMLKNVCTISDLLGPLPDKAWISIKLYYYDDVTPMDYEPIGFVPSQNETYTFPSKTMKIQLGKIDTDDHGFKVFLKTSLMQRSSENSVLNTSQTTNDPSLVNEKETMDHKSSQRSHSGKSDTGELQCLCNSKTEELSEVVVCRSCGKGQHSVCYAFMNPEDIPTLFYCVDCMLGNTDGTSSQDIIYELPIEDREIFCLMRRCLILCSTLKTVGRVILEKNLGCVKAVATHLMERLEFEGYIKKSGRKYVVNESSIRDLGFAKYFPDKEKENVDTDALCEDYYQNEELNEIYAYDQNQGSTKDSTDVYSETDIIENSISQVKALSLGNNIKERHTSQHSQERKSSQNKLGSSIRSSRKRKLSEANALLSPDNSVDLFQTPSFKVKKPRK